VPQGHLEHPGDPGPEGQRRQERGGQPEIVLDEEGADDGGQALDAVGHIDHQGGQIREPHLAPDLEDVAVEPMADCGNESTLIRSSGMPAANGGHGCVLTIDKGPKGTPSPSRRRALDRAVPTPATRRHGSACRSRAVARGGPCSALRASWPVAQSAEDMRDTAERVSRYALGFGRTIHRTRPRLSAGTGFRGYTQMSEQGPRVRLDDDAIRGSARVGSLPADSDRHGQSEGA
jgi:hypothetical protein